MGTMNWQWKAIFAIEALAIVLALIGVIEAFS